METTIDGLKINYIQEGTGQDVLLLHGWGGSIQTMIPVLNILKKSYRVTVPDLPGFGDSDLPQKAFNSYDYTEVIRKFMEAAQMGETIIAGHSHGGRIALIMAALYGEKIKKLILIDSAGIKPKRKAAYYFKVFSFKLMKKVYLLWSKIPGRKENLEKFYKKYGSEDYKNVSGHMRETLVKVINDDLEHLLHRIECPTLIVWGENDEDTPLFMGRKMEEKIKDSGLVVIKHAGHYSYVDNYGMFRRVIESFMNITGE